MNNAVTSAVQSVDAVQEYFANTPCDGFIWTLDYNGVTFYFADGDLEELNITGYFDSDVLMYTKFGVYTDTDGSYRYEECSASGFIPYYVKTSGGNHYLYLFCEQYEGGPVPMFALRVYDVSGGNITGVGEMNAGPGYIPVDAYKVPTDPDDFYLEDFDAMTQDMMKFSVGPTGLPELKP